MLHRLRQLFGAKPPHSGLCVYSPMEGAVLALSAVNDLAFSKEFLGKGLAIVPVSGKVYAPFHGRVLQISASNHAIGLVSSSGIQVLIHIGIDTIQLKGKHFLPCTNAGNLVQKGDVLLEFDLPAIVQSGFEITSPLLICNPDNFMHIELTTAASVRPMDEMMWLQK